MVHELLNTCFKKIKSVCDSGFFNAVINFLDIIHHPNFYFSFWRIMVGLFLPEDGDKSLVSETFKIKITTVDNV